MGSLCFMCRNLYLRVHVPLFFSHPMYTRHELMFQFAYYFCSKLLYTQVMRLLLVSNCNVVKVKTTYSVSMYVHIITSYTFHQMYIPTYAILPHILFVCIRNIIHMRVHYRFCTWYHIRETTTSYLSRTRRPFTYDQNVCGLILNELVHMHICIKEAVSMNKINTIKMCRSVNLQPLSSLQRI